MGDAPTLITVALAAIALGAGALKLAQGVLRKNGNGKSKSGDISPEQWKSWLAEIQTEVSQKVMVQILKPTMDAQTDVLREIRASEREIRDGIVRLVALQESHERRGE